MCIAGCCQHFSFKQEQITEVMLFLLLLLLACAITYHSHVQSTVLEPCSRLIIQINEAIHPLRRAVDGPASTRDVFCRWFGTTITTVARRSIVPSEAYLRHIYRPQSVACLVGSRLVRIDPHPVRCLMVWA